MNYRNGIPESYYIRSDIVNKLNFKHPFLIKESKNISFSQIFSLHIDGKWIMDDNSIKMACFFEALPFFYFASGHCICTGLGMGIRETLLLQNKNVTKITVLENNLDLIEYHKENKTPFMDHVEIIHCDASTYVGSCETLFLDHYSENNFRGNLNGVISPFLCKSFLEDTVNVSNNIKHNKLWFRGLEEICISYNPESRYKVYSILKQKCLNLPDLDEKTFNDIIMIYVHKDQDLGIINDVIDTSFINLTKNEKV